MSRAAVRRSQPRHRRARTGLVIAISVVAATAGTLAVGPAAGWFGDEGRAGAAETGPGKDASGKGGSRWADGPDGFASLTSRGQKGTYGGRDGKTVTVRTEAELKKYATAEEPYTIRVEGAIKYAEKGEEIKVASDKTIVGAGDSGEIVEGGFFLGEGVHNVIIRNLTIRDTYDGEWDGKDHDWDAIQMDGAHHVWIDHNRLTRMADGLIDSRKNTTNVTVSWNRLENHNKAFGIGWTEDATAELTVHHNWFRETQQRNPSVDNVAHAHLYNNYLQDDPEGRVQSSYGNLARGATKLVLENSYFEGFHDPYKVQDSAELVERGSVTKDTTGATDTRGTAFDPHEFYDYELDPAEQVPDILRERSGPQAGLGAGGAAATAAKGKAATAAKGKKVTVGKRAGADFRTVQEAIDSVPENNDSPVTLSLAPGTYREKIHVPADKPHIRLEGSGSSREKTTLVHGDAAGTPGEDGDPVGTAGSASVTVEADDFQARNLTVANDFDESDSGVKDKQAVALRTVGDKIVLNDVAVLGNQDTLLLDTPDKSEPSRVYVTGSRIAGDVDFIFGRASAVIHDSDIELVPRGDGSGKTGGYVTAPSTAAKTPGILVTGSRVSGDVPDGSFHLGRPWHAGGDASLDPQTVVRDTELSGAVKDAPWTDMGGFSWKDDRFAEYRNTGPGAGEPGEDRPHLTDEEAAGAEAQDWLGDWKPTSGR